MLLSHGQAIALHHHLTNFPENVSFETILEMIEDKKMDITIWYPFEMWNTYSFIDHIRMLSKSIDTAIVEALNNI